MTCTRIDKARAEPAESSSLSEIVLSGVRPVKELKQDMDRKEGRPCVKAYLDAISPKAYLWLPNVPSGPAGAVDARRRNLVEQADADKPHR